MKTFRVRWRRFKCNEAVWKSERISRECQFQDCWKSRAERLSEWTVSRVRNCTEACVNWLKTYFFRMSIPSERLLEPPLCQEEKKVISEVGTWRGLFYPAFLVGIGAGAYIKQFKPHAVNSQLMTKLRRMSSSSLLGIGFMEFFGENYYLSKNLPEGYYKWTYGQLSPVQFRIRSKFWLNKKLRSEKISTIV